MRLQDPAQKQNSGSCQWQLVNSHGSNNCEELKFEENSYMKLVCVIKIYEYFILHGMVLQRTKHKDIDCNFIKEKDSLARHYGDVRKILQTYSPSPCCFLK